MATRFDYRNLAGQCKEENCSEGGKSYEGGIATDTNFGKRTAQQLFKLSTNYEAVKHWDIGDLVLVILLVFLSPAC
jgi:hypothetical protein